MTEWSRRPRGPDTSGLAKSITRIGGRLDIGHAEGREREKWVVLIGLHLQDGFQHPGEGKAIR